MPYNDSDQGGQSWRLEGFSRRRFLTTLATAAASSHLAAGLGSAMQLCASDPDDAQPVDAPDPLGVIPRKRHERDTSTSRELYDLA